MRNERQKTKDERRKTKTHAVDVWRRVVAPGLLGSLLLSLEACGPNYGPIARERMDRIIKLEETNTLLQARLTDSQANEKSLRAQLAGQTPRLSTLPDDRLQELLVAARIELQRSTDAAALDGSPVLNGYRVYLRPMAEDEQPIPATGTLTVEAFDLARHDSSQRIGSWTFTPIQMKAHWYSGFGLNHFAVNCPWKEPPEHADITFKITFVDALTGRLLLDQQLIHLHLKPR